jgi:allantoinase
MSAPPPDGMLPQQRLPYAATHAVRAAPLPGGRRIAAWVIVNIEEWDPTQPLPRTVNTPPAGGQAAAPDIPSWCWHEYGNRSGFWRLLDIFDDAGVKPALAINGCAVETYRAISTAALERGWEFMGHGFTQRSMQRVPDEAEDIRLTTEAITRFTGARPRGWLGPGLQETWTTPERLVDAGYDYVCDWVLDDVPLRLATRNGSIASVPYTQEINDVPMMLIQHHPAREWRDRAVDQFEQLRADAARHDSPRVLALVVHPYIMGAPHRARHVREALAHINASGDAHWMTGSSILDHWKV